MSESGSGSSPLVILPGLLCDQRMFRGQEAAFDAQVIGGFYDGCDRIEAMAEYALARMPERCALFGHSMGGGSRWKYGGSRRNG